MARGNIGKSAPIGSILSDAKYPLPGSAGTLRIGYQHDVPPRLHIVVGRHELIRAALALPTCQRESCLVDRCDVTGPSRGSNKGLMGRTGVPTLRRSGEDAKRPPVDRATPK